MGRTGRPSIFTNKQTDSKIQAQLTDHGWLMFERARRRLAEIAGWKVKNVSDADTVEYLARGDDDSQMYIEDQQGRAAGRHS